MAGSPIFSVNFTNRRNSVVLNHYTSWSWSESLRVSSLLELKYTSTLSCRRLYDETSSAPEGNKRVETFPAGFPRRPRARSIQPKFQPVRPGKVVHLKRRTPFFETFRVGPNRSIEFWTEISGHFCGTDCAPTHERSRCYDVKRRLSRHALDRK